MKVEEAPIQEIVLSEEAIQQRVRSLALQVSSDYAENGIHLVAVLKGALVFLADFSRALTIQATLDFMVVSSYQETRSTGEVRILKDLDYPIADRHVLLVEDVIDNGVTIQSLLTTLKLRKPASLKVCTLLDKREKRAAPFQPDYNGFVISNQFVVGYGLDYNERYRNLPYIATLRKEVYEHF